MERVGVDEESPVGVFVDEGALAGARKQRSQEGFRYLNRGAGSGGDG